MKILVIGGARFLGRNLVEIAAKQNHEITLFNRGKTNPDVFPDLECIRGDRDSDINLLGGRKWDVVVDTCGYVPKTVEISVRFLAEAVDQYVFISSIDAYCDYTITGISEDSPLATMKDEAVELINSVKQVNGENYGPLKVLCEKVAEKLMPGRVLVLRCGLIVGPHDPTDRFTYWPVRMSQEDEILAPSPPYVQVQFVDARDLAEFILLAAQNEQNGIFNTTGPAYKLTMEKFLQECLDVTKAKSNITWLSEEFILKNKIDLPVWVPSEYHGINEVNCQKAISAGLVFRPLSETIKDTLVWYKTQPKDHKLRSGIAQERERELLDLWHKTTK